MTEREQKGNSRRKTTYWLIFRGDDAVDLSFKCQMPFDKEFGGHSSRSFLQCGSYTMRKVTQCWTEQYEGDVFDLEVDKQESYNVEGIICHNSFMGGDVLPSRPGKKFRTGAEDLWHPQEERDQLDVQHLLR